ncbi:MAG: hypothetical protein ACE3L7_30515 [Candidatus Pristimantibacillus sp.]
MSNATTQKSDSWDAYCIAKVLLARVDELPEAIPQDIYWTIGQLVARRNSIVKHASGLKNQLHPIELSLPCSIRSTSVT